MTFRINNNVLNPILPDFQKLSNLYVSVFCLLGEKTSHLKPSYVLLPEDLLYSPTKWNEWRMIGFRDGWLARPRDT